MRQFFGMSVSWPEQLPSTGGDALVVAGLEGCLDALSETDAEEWLSDHFRTVVLSFQSHYEGQAALVSGFPRGVGFGSSRKLQRRSRVPFVHAVRPGRAQKERILCQRGSSILIACPAGTPTAQRIPLRHAD